MFANTDAVFFDMDGTIVDSMWMWRDIDRTFLEKRGIAVPAGLSREIEGFNFPETAKYFRKRFRLAESAEEIMSCWNDMAMEKYRHEIFVKTGFRPFLEALKRAGKKLAVATNNSKELALCGLKANRIVNYFDTVVTGSDGFPGKPAPDVYLECARRCKAAPERCLVFEDLVHGIMAGKQAGMRVCAVYDRYSEQSDPQKKELSDYYIRSYEELVDLVYTGGKNAASA